MLASLLLLPLALATPLSGHGHGPNRLGGRRHSSRHSSTRIEKRGFDGKATYYEAGLGACGGYNSGSDKIVALNAAQWDGGAHCGKTVTITEGGHTASATIVDLCPGCPFGALDFSQSLFEIFHETGKGVFQMSWSFSDGSGGGNQQQPETTKKDEPKPTPTPEPTTQWTPAPTSETPIPTPTPVQDTTSSSSSSETPASSATSSSAVVSSSAIVSSSAAANSTILSSTAVLNSTVLASSTAAANSTAPLPSASGSPASGNDAIVVSTASEGGSLAGINNLVASMGRLVVLGASS